MSLTIEQRGSQLVSEEASSENADLRQVDFISTDDGVLAVSSRKRKPAYLTVRLTEAFLPQDRSYTTLVKKCFELAQAYDGMAISMTFPWENNSKYHFGEVIKLKK